MFGREANDSPLSGLSPGVMPPSGLSHGTGPPEAVNEGPLVALFALLVIVLVGGLLVKLQDDASSKKSATSAAAPGTASGPTAERPSKASRSYLNPDVLTRELRRLDARAGGRARVVDLRLDNNMFWATIADRDDNQEMITVSPDGSRDVHPIAVAVTDFVPSNRIDPRIPSRLIAAVRERTHRRPQDIDYVVFSAAFAKLGSAWSVFLNKGPATQRQFVAALDGTDLHHPGEPSQAQRRRVDCLQRARDADAVRRCIS
jgi:hypothetical protein